MTDVFRIIGLGVVGIIALWIFLELLVIVLWIVSTIVSLAILALVVYVGYIVVTTVLN